jgi:hypothetical protein
VRVPTRLPGSILLDLSRDKKDGLFPFEAFDSPGNSFSEAAVPFCLILTDFDRNSTCFARPKSSNLVVNGGSLKMYILPGFTSRCIISWTGGRKQ